MPLAIRAQVSRRPVGFSVDANTHKRGLYAQIQHRRPGAMPGEASVFKHAIVNMKPARVRATQGRSHRVNIRIEGVQSIELLARLFLLYPLLWPSTKTRAIAGTNHGNSTMLSLSTRFRRRSCLISARPVTNIQSTPSLPTRTWRTSLRQHLATTPHHRSPYSHPPRPPSLL